MRMSEQPCLLLFTRSNGLIAPVKDNKYLATAVKLFMMAAKQDHADAQYHLGFCFQHGIGVPVNLIQAVDY